MTGGKLLPHRCYCNLRFLVIMPPSHTDSKREKDTSSDVSSTPPPPDKKGNNEESGRPVSNEQSWLKLLDRRINRFDLDFEELRKRRLFIILAIPGICFLFSFAFTHLYHNNRLEGFSDLAAGLWLGLILIAFRSMRNAGNVYRLNTFFLGCLFVYLAVKGGVEGNKLMWAFSFPPIAFFTLGKREGSLATLLFYLIIIAVLYHVLPYIPVHDYAPEFKLRFCLAFLLVGVWTYLYESARQQYQNTLQDERNKLDSEKSKLAELSSTLSDLNRALSQSESRMIRAQAIARVGNLEYDVASRMVWGSEEALRILGVNTPNSKFPLSVMAKIIPNFIEFRQDFEHCMINGLEYDRELVIHRLADGKPAVLHAMAELVRNDTTGFAEKTIGVIQDITERKEAEQEKRQLEEKLARSQKMEALGLLAGGVAHDLNNVLSGIVSYPDLLLRDLPDGHPMVLPLQKILESGHKAAAIVQDLLTLARRGVTNHRAVNLNTLVEEYLASPEHNDIVGRHMGITIETHFDPDLFNIKGSEMHLKKSLANLVANSAEALPAGGSIRISTENRYIDISANGYYSDVPQGEYAILQVEDNGIGIAKEDLSRIFEPFYTKKKMGRSGTGLGMAVIWGTVKDHQGHIQINSEEGQGTRIVLYFPVTRELVDDSDHFIPLEDYLGREERILVVDDILEQRELADRLLTKLGYLIYTVAGGEEALDFLSNHSVQLVILDMIMDPGIDGLETYTRILASHPQQRTIIVSGFAETERVREAQRLGVKAYVKKPYTMEKLGMAVRKALKE